MNNDAKKWMQAAPPSVRHAFGSVRLQNFLREHRKFCFQMIGAYDGAMSETCKDDFLSHYEVISALVAACEEWNNTPLEE